MPTRSRATAVNAVGVDAVLERSSRTSLRGPEINSRACRRGARQGLPPTSPSGQQVPDLHRRIR